MGPYANAADVLPPELFKEVQRRWQGTLYIAPPKVEKVDLIRKAALEMIKEGCSESEVAVLNDIPISKVRAIARSLGRLNPYNISAKMKREIALKRAQDARGCFDCPGRPRPRHIASASVERGVLGVRERHNSEEREK